MTNVSKYSIPESVSQRNVRYIRAVLDFAHVRHAHLSDMQVSDWIVAWEQMIDKAGWDRDDVRAWARVMALTVRKGEAK